MKISTFSRKRESERERGDKQKEERETLIFDTQETFEKFKRKTESTLKI